MSLKRRDFLRLVGKATLGTAIAAAGAPLALSENYAYATETDIPERAVTDPDRYSQDREYAMSGLYTPYLSLELGSINSSDGQDAFGDQRCRTSDYIPIDTFVSCKLTQLSDYQMIVFCYSAKIAYLGRIFPDWSNTDIDRIGAVAAYADAAYLRIVFKHISGRTLNIDDLKALQAVIVVATVPTLQNADETARKSRLDSKFQIVAYSVVHNDAAPINSKEHFLECASASYDGIKGDIAITSDKRLIMCHDSGYTFDSSGRITTYDSSNSTPIRSMTYDQVRALAFVQQYHGNDVHPADIDDFLRAAKRYGKLPYIVIRDNYMSEVVPILVQKLREYELLSSCIVASFSWSSIELVRGCSPEITVSWVTRYQAAPTAEDADRLAMLGNAALCIFDQGQNISANQAVCEYARKKGIRIWGAQATSVSTITNYLNAGYSGVQSLEEYSVNDTAAAVFYGLAKAAGVDLKSSAAPVGIYTEEAKAAIRAMLGID